VKNMEKVLEIKNLEVSFNSASGKYKILSGVNLSIRKNETVALVGESGCGKTLTSLAVIKLLPRNAFFENGEIFLHNQDIVKCDEKTMEKIRGEKVGMIFQEPASYLNPVFTVGNQVEESIKGTAAKEEKREKVFRIFKEVGLKKNNYFQYPHQLSGGMQQRVMISMALINNPSLLIADEPTTALDVTTSMRIMELLKSLMQKFGISILFITHDISLAGSFSDKVAVMYAGRIIEFSEARKIFEEPLHPYTKSLIECLPEKYHRGGKIRTIKGNVPDFKNLPKGCLFHPRCREKMDICEEKVPGETVVNGRIVRCFKYEPTLES